MLWKILILTGLFVTASASAIAVQECGKQVAHSRLPVFQVEKNAVASVKQGNKFIVLTLIQQEDLEYWGFESLREFKRDAESRIHFGEPILHPLPFNEDSLERHFREKAYQFDRNWNAETYQQKAFSAARSLDPLVMTLHFFHRGMDVIARYNPQTKELVVVNANTGRLLSFYILESKKVEDRMVTSFTRFLGNLAHPATRYGNETR